jgi:hypothetical protein
MSQVRISKLNTWGRHEQKVLAVLLKALSLLRAKRELMKSEVFLNRELFFCLLEANRALWDSGEGGFSYPPIPEGKNLPDPNDEERKEREDKIPDFNWCYIDHSQADPRKSAHCFVIECKRLGRTLDSQWILNENYVKHGILRFVTTKHGYAQGESSAAMVGYVQDMDHSDILGDVNRVAISESLPPISPPAAGWVINGTSSMEHIITRSFRVSPLRLWHCWVDIRNCY